MDTKNRIASTFKSLWDKGYSMGEIAWMMDITIIEVGELVKRYGK